MNCPKCDKPMEAMQEWKFNKPQNWIKAGFYCWNCGIKVDISSDTGSRIEWRKNPDGSFTQMGWSKQLDSK